MRTIRFWMPAIVGTIATPVCLYLITLSASFSTGASGHAGAGLVAMAIFYPLPTTVMMFAGRPARDASVSQVISVLAFGGIFLQFPVYGLIIGYANLKRSVLSKLCAGIVYLHVFIIVALVSVYLIQTLLG
ncbi:MAG TPA: hypothetical protein VN476_09965 [Pyrinomonadaceae bacterium]|nr:hypothetical protein [Pyrinomonadaceae bacterium]